MSAAGGRLPYPGLRSFTREETDLFFGREGCVDDMVDRLAATRFLAVLGASGSGKSSLVKTGLLDALELGLLTRAGSRWVIADFRPGDRPIHNLAEGLLRATSPDPAAQPDEEETKLLRTFLARGPRSVVEWCEADNLPEGANLLLLVDQFEELFRYSAYAEREEAEAFVALLLESARASLGEARIYVAITMRSEYLGAAALIDGLAEAINHGLYLTPRMSRDQVREAIVGPAAVCGFSIEPALVNRLLNDLTSFAPWEDADTGHQLERLVRRADQLPLMQHVLNRLYSLAEDKSRGGPIVLKLADYDGLGGLRGALAAHGREILDELLPEHQEVASAVFRGLTAGSSLAEAVRRPTEFGELVEIAGGDEIAVREIVEAFRAPGRNFLVPPRPAPLRPATVIDISHESLIRQWDEFAGWLQREITSAETWRRLVDAAVRYRRREANLLSGLALASIASWWDTEHPTAAWAKRYGGDFGQAAEFLAESRRAEDASKQAEIEERRQKSRNRLVTLAVVLILCIITPLTGFAGYMAWHASREATRANQEATAAGKARALAESERQAAEAERERADQERTRALTAQKEAIDQAAAADAERARADEERERAIAAQKEAVDQAAAAEAERQRADEERARAIDAQKEAMQQAAAAEAARNAAEAARKDAMQQAAEAEAARNAAEAAQKEAIEQAAAAQAAQQQVIELERQRAKEAFRRSILEQVADRISALQQAGSWGIASNLLGALWQGVIGPSGDQRDGWLIDPIVRAFSRQSMAEYPVFPEFLNYGGYTGWTGTPGRFRVYSLDHKAADGTAIAGNKIMMTFDAMTGAVLGSFELPSGSELGSEADLVSPDGNRVAIVTDKAEIALWAVGQKAATFIPVPDRGGGKVAVAQLAPVNSDARYAIYLTLDDKPDEILVVDPATQSVTFTVTAADIASGAGLASVDDVKLLGLVDNRLMLLVNTADGLVVTVDTGDGKVGVMETGTGVLGAEITPDGLLLLTLTCPGSSCAEQHLTAFDIKQNVPLWVERVPVGLTLSEPAAQMTRVDGQPVYSALVQNKGVGIALQIPVNASGAVQRLDVDTHARMGETSFDGNGNFRVVEAAKDITSDEGISAAGLLASYRIPLSRQKLRLYVARNSVGIYQDEDTVRIAGVTYTGELLVYRLREDGEFEEDVAFRPLSLGESNCLSAVAFGGDGESLLIRNADGSLYYAAAIGHGASVGWQRIDQSGARFEESQPATTCDAPAEDAPVERIAAADQDGRAFALLDKDGVAWWVNVVDKQGKDGGEGEGGAAPGSTATAREFAPLERLADDISWLAGDPERNRVAVVTRTAVEIATRGRAIASDTRNTRAELQPADAPDPELSADAARDRPGRQRLLRWNEPKATAFSLEGDVVVTYGGGQISAFHESEEGTWSVKFDNVVFRSQFVGLYAAKGGIAVADDRNMMLAIDAETGALSGFARLPANPAAMALRADGNALSLEWDTDSVATTAFRAIQPDSAVDAARLVAMRSLLDGESDASLDSLMIEQKMERSSASVAEDSRTDCANAATWRIPLLESRVLGEVVSEAAVQESTNCAASDESAALRAAEMLAERGPGASVRELVEDGAFSRVLQGAAAGDATASRVLGAALARITLERGDLDATEIAKDAMRFGTSLPATLMPAIASGGAIDPALVELARGRTGADPAAHQLLAHWDERQINDIDALANALLEFSLAERLYRAGGRADDAKFVAHRRAQLARVLPDDRVLAVMAAADAWTPAPPDTAPVTTLPDLPPNAAARRALDMENVGLLAQRLPDSPLLAALHTELERARIIDLRRTDPKGAADLLIDLGRRSGGETRWSPDLVREYLGLADDIGEGADTASAFRLAAEAVKMIGAVFKSPVHADSEASGLLRRAMDMVAAIAPSVPRDVAAAAMNEADLSLLAYEYDNLPGAKVEAESTAAQQVLESAARMADAIAKSSDDPQKWNRLRGLSLFWQGVLINDTDSAKAAPVLRASADVLRSVVEAEPADAESRFRYAEALRWVGLAEPSSAETAAIERDAIGEYQTLWKDRSTLDPALLSRVGVGYGFALANLAQTTREFELADLTDGRTAEEHADWVLEMLALAAEKDDLNATMISMGAATGDSGFVGGWYRMSSYGWPLGFLSGLVNVETGNETVTECDLLAADPFDPRRRAPGLVLDRVDVAKAEATCRAEGESNPADHRATYQLARTISSDTKREAEYLPLARTAAAAGVSPAFALVAYALSEKEDDRSGDAYIAASQRTFIESFPVLYPYLQKHAKTDRERAGLAWYAGKAGALGVAEAHLALADLTKDPQEKLFHLDLAARLFGEAGDAAGAAAAREKAGAVLVRNADQQRIEAEVAEWSPEALVELPADPGAS